MACEAHDIRLGEIRKSPGREQSARVLLSARLRSINIKKLANIDGVAQDERITRAIMPSKIQLVRVDLNIPKYRDVNWAGRTPSKRGCGMSAKNPTSGTAFQNCLQLGIGPEAMNHGQYHQTGLRNAKPLKKRNGGWHGEGCQNGQHQYHRVEKMKVGLKDSVLELLPEKLI